MALVLKLDETKLSLNKSALRKELRSIAKDIKNRTQQLIRSSIATGEKRGKHTASAPGQAPANQTGFLASSITYSVKRDSVIIRDNSYYSLFLEAGASKTGKSQKGIIKPRPFLSRVLEEMEPEIKERLSKAINEGITLK